LSKHSFACLSVLNGVFDQFLKVRDLRVGLCIKACWLEGEYFEVLWVAFGFHDGEKTKIYVDVQIAKMDMVVVVMTTRGSGVHHYPAIAGNLVSTFVER